MNLPLNEVKGESPGSLKMPSKIEGIWDLDFDNPLSYRFNFKTDFFGQQSISLIDIIAITVNSRTERNDDGITRIPIESVVDKSMVKIIKDIIVTKSHRIPNIEDINPDLLRLQEFFFLRNNQCLLNIFSEIIDKMSTHNELNALGGKLKAQLKFLKNNEKELEIIIYPELTEIYADIFRLIGRRIIEIQIVSGELTVENILDKNK